MSPSALKHRGQRLAEKYSLASLKDALKFAKRHRDHDEVVAINWALKENDSD